MSIVNDALKQLQNRKNSNEMLDGLDVSHGSVPLPKNNRRLIVLLVILVIVAIGVGILFFLPKEKSAIIKQVDNAKSLRQSQTASLPQTKDSNTLATANQKLTPENLTKSKDTKEIFSDAETPTVAETQKATPATTPEQPTQATTQPVVANKTTENNVPGMTKEAIPSTPLSLAEKTFAQATDFINQGKIESALKIYKSILATLPTFEPASTALASYYISQGQINAAKTVIAQGLAANPSAYKLIELKAYLLDKQGQIEQAINLLRLSSPQIETHPGYYALLADLYRRNNTPDLAASMYRQILTATPTDSKLWLGLAISYEQANLASSARNAYRQAISTGGLSPVLSAFAATRLQALGGQAS